MKKRPLNASVLLLLLHYTTADSLTNMKKNISQLTKIMYNFLGIFSVLFLVPIECRARVFSNNVKQVYQTIKQETSRKQMKSSGIPVITNYTAYMHIFTEEDGDASQNWNATIVEYFTLFPNGNSFARDDNFYIMFANTNTAAEDSVEIGYCYADADLQDTYTITYPTNPKDEKCLYYNLPNYEQGCVSYFANMPNTLHTGECISPYNNKTGDKYVLDFPDIVYLEYCMELGSVTRPLYYKSILNNQTMLVIFALFANEAAPMKMFDLPDICKPVSTSVVV
jgi:hypothetical protein